MPLAIMESHPQGLQLNFKGTLWVMLTNPVDSYVVLTNSIDPNIELTNPDDSYVMLTNPVDSNIELTNPVDSYVVLTNPTLTLS